MKGRWTKDERFVLCAYEAAMRLGDINAILDRYEVGKAAGLAAGAVDTICNLLAQANFIKKISKVEIKLTPNGETLALRLAQE